MQILEAAQAHQQWHDIESEVISNLEETIRTVNRYDGAGWTIKADASSSDPTVVDPDLRRERMLRSEAAFCIRVWSAALARHQSGQNLSILYDIDQTLGSRKEDKQTGEKATVLRPSALPLMRQLGSYYDLTSGIITSRGRQDIEENMTDPLHLLAINPFISAKHIVAADDLPVQIGKETTNATLSRDQYEGIRHILAEPWTDYETFMQFTVKDKPLPQIDIVKLVQIAAMHDPSTDYLVIDDHAYPKLLHNNAGVALEEDEHAHY